MARYDFEFTWQRRRATYAPIVDRPALGLTKGQEVQCRVWGCYQVNDGEDINPYFVIELENGRCTHASPEQIQFIEFDEEDDDVENSN